MSEKEGPELRFAKEDERVVLLNTGTGLKYPDTVHVTAPILQAEDDVPQHW
jgi:threonine synthase